MAVPSSRRQVQLVVPPGEPFDLRVLDDGRVDSLGLDHGQLKELLELGAALPARDAGADGVALLEVEVGDGVRVWLDGTGLTHDGVAELLGRAVAHALRAFLDQHAPEAAAADGSGAAPDPDDPVGPAS